MHLQPGIAAGTIRAYCGAPLNMTFGRHTVTIGTLATNFAALLWLSLYHCTVLGSLCVADNKPRPDFNEDIELALVSYPTLMLLYGYSLHSTCESRSKTSQPVSEGSSSCCMYMRSKSSSKSCMRVSHHLNRNAQAPFELSLRYFSFSTIPAGLFTGPAHS